VDVDLPSFPFGMELYSTALFVLEF
jgi:hypothetical protein